MAAVTSCEDVEWVIRELGSVKLRIGTTSDIRRFSDNCTFCITIYFMTEKFANAWVNKLMINAKLAFSQPMTAK